METKEIWRDIAGYEGLYQSAYGYKWEYNNQ